MERLSSSTARVIIHSISTGGEVVKNLNIEILWIVLE
jgi:hypothetical protein